MKNLLLIILTNLIFINSDQSCTNITPNTSTDCTSMSFKSNNKVLCCFLNATNSPSLYTTCIEMFTNSTTSLITVGNMIYTIECNNKELFPFENNGFNPCGITDPITGSDCYKGISGDSSMCCLGSNTSDFSFNPNCYEYKTNTVGNYTLKVNDSFSLHFQCYNSIINTKMINLITFLILIILL